MTSPDEAPVVANLPLWKSFVTGLFGSIFFAGILGLLLNYSRGALSLDLSENAIAIIGWVIFLPFYFVVMISLWKCAYNTSLVFLGHLARIYAVLTTLLLWIIFVTIILE